MSPFIFNEKRLLQCHLDKSGNCAVAVKSPPGTRDEYEIAEIIITRSINNKEYTYIVWRDDSTFEDPLEFGATYVFLPDLQTLDMNIYFFINVKFFICGEFGNYFQYMFNLYSFKYYYNFYSENNW